MYRARHSQARSRQWRTANPVPAQHATDTSRTLADDMDWKESTDQTSMRESSGRGFALSTAQAVANRLLSLVSFTVLARLLDPSAYGVAALANVFFIMFATLSASGFGSTLAQRESVDRRYVDTTFWVALATGCAMAGVMLGIAFPLGAAFHSSLLGPVLAVLSVNFIMIGLTSTPVALLQRAMRFGRLAVVSVASNIVATAVGVTFAFLGFGVWAITVQTLLAPAVSTVLFWMRSDYRPTRCFDRTLIRPIYRRSLEFFGAQFMQFIGQHTDDLLIGIRLGNIALGIYTIGYRFVGIMMEVLATGAEVVALPSFARLQSQPHRLPGALKSALRMSAAVVLPSFVVVFVLAPQLIRTVFGDHWAESVPIVRVLCGYGVVEAVMFVCLTFLQSLGQTRLALKIATAGTVLQVAGFLLAANFGLVWVAAAYVARSVLLAPVIVRAACRRVELPVRALLRELVPPAVIAALIAATLVGLRAAVGDWSRPVQLVALLAVAAVEYPLLLRVVSRNEFTLLVSIARSLAPGRRDAVPTAG